MIWQMMTTEDSKVEYGTMTGEHVVLSKICADFKCSSVSGEEMRHWEIFKISRQDYMTRPSLKRRGVEPSYAEKIAILREIGRWKNVALEVMPNQAELVDRENLYHMWEFEHLESFRYNPQPIFDIPEIFQNNFEGTFYNVVNKNGIEYIYFTTDGKMPWRKKQALKNHAVGPYREGVEIITEKMHDMGYSAIIVLPRNHCLSFSLV